MRDLLWLIRERLVLWRRHPLQVFFLLGIPFLSVFLYLVIGSQGEQPGLTVGVTDHDRTADSRLLVSSLKQRSAVKLVKRAHADKALSQGQVTAVMTIPQGYQRGIQAGNHPQLLLRSLQEGATVKAVSSLVTTAYQTVLSVHRLSSPTVSTNQIVHYLHQQTPQFTIKQIDQKDTVKALTLQILGFMLMMMLYQANSFGTTNLQNERRNKIYQRTMLTPVSSVTYFAATAAFAMLAMAFEVLLTVGAMVGLFHIDPGLSAGQLIGILLAFGLVAVMWAIAVGVLASSSKVASGVQTMLITITSLISGALIPMTVMPPFMQKLGMITPQYWTLAAIRHLQAGLTSHVWGDLLIIGAFSLLFFSIAVYGFSRRRHQENYD